MRQIWLKVLKPSNRFLANYFINNEEFMKNNGIIAAINGLYFYCQELLVVFKILRKLLNRNSLDLKLITSEIEIIEQDMNKNYESIIDISFYIHNFIGKGNQTTAGIERLKSVFCKVCFNAQDLPVLFQKANIIRYTIPVYGQNISKCLEEIIKFCWNSIAELNAVLELFPIDRSFDSYKHLPEMPSESRDASNPNLFS
jgi:hypothetical protein